MYNFTLSMTRRRKDMLFWSLAIVVALLSCNAATGNVVLPVKHKYGGRKNSTLTTMRAHDAKRHGRSLAALDIALGGDEKITSAALYYTSLAIGSPSQEFYVQVDTGSDILWVNCAGCDKCPKKSPLGIDLKFYDLTKSSTGKQVNCDESFCNVVYEGKVSGCVKAKACTYSIRYADGSGSQGIFVNDNISFDQVTGNLQTATTIGNFSFGCSSSQTGSKETSTDRVSGIIGFGQSNSSIISQLAISKKTKKLFSHCLDGEDGGGIFAIGQVTEPNVQTTPLLADQTHYNVMMEKFEVYGEKMPVPTDSFLDSGRKTVIDTGSTLAHLPNSFYDVLIRKVLGRQRDLKPYPYEKQFTCFRYKGKIDDGFPTITLYFRGGLPMRIYPHQYLLNVHEKDQYCIGFQRGGMKNMRGDDLVLLGDIVLTNKLVVYDLEKQTIGWTEYNCSSSIKVKDDGSGNVYSVDAHDISPSSASNVKAKLFTCLLFAAILAM